MVRAEVVRRRLQALQEHLAILERLARYDEPRFLGDAERYGSAERFLQLSLETLLDIGSHIIADMDLGAVHRSRDIPRLFREHGYIDSDLEERWLRMIGFRNILVHAYLDLDRGEVYRILQTGLDDIRAVQAVFAEFL